MDKKHLSETLRIDLIPGATSTETAEEQPRPLNALRVNRPRRPEEPTSVARSRYQELLQSVYDAALLTNVHGRITDANVRAVEFFGRSRDELCAMRIQDVISGADAQLLETLCEALRNEQFTLIQAYCNRRDGSFFPAEIAVNMLRFGQIYLCFFIRDITLRKMSEDRLRIEHEALQHAATGIVIANLNMTIEYSNPAFARDMGRTDPERMVGSSLFELAADGEAMQSLVAAATESDSPWRGTVAFRTAGGNKTFQACATCCRDSDGDPFGLILSLDEAARTDQEDSARIRELEEEIARLKAERHTTV